MLLVKKNGTITSYVEYFISKKDLGFLQDNEKVNYSKKAENFEGTIALENSKREFHIIYSSETKDDCEEPTLKTASPDSCLGLYQLWDDGSRTLLYIISCNYSSGTSSDGGSTGGGTSGTIAPSPSCNCNICPVCGKCLELLKSAPVPGSGGTTIAVACPVCTGHPVPIVNAISLENNPKANCIYQKLLNGGTLSNFISRYFGISQPNESFLGELNLTWTLGGTDHDGETIPIGSPRNGVYNSVEIRLNESKLNTTSSTLVAMTMLHEALHAKFVAEYYDSIGSTDFGKLYSYYKWGNGNYDTNQESLMLNGYADEMAGALQSFDQSKGIYQDISVYKEALKYNLASNILGSGSYPSGGTAYNTLFNSSKNCN